jgi:diguanylate cyclase (GGDEF)-like protein/PAS domain S-box-containing protein
MPFEGEKMKNGAEGISSADETRNRYRTLIEWSPSAAVVYCGGNVVSANAAAIDLIGASCEQDLLGTPVLDLLHPDCRQTALARMLSARHGNGPSPPVEEKLIRCDGSVIDIETQIASMVIDGKTFGIVSIRDITERKLGQASAEQYRAVVQASMDGYWITDNNGRILEANDSMCAMHGYTRDEIVGLHIPDLEADESQADFQAHTRQMIEKGHVRFEARHRRRDGSVFHVDVSVLHTPALGELFFAFVRDISERKAAEEKLQLAASVFVHSREGIIVTDPQGAIIEVNAAFTRITGYTREEVLGRNPGLLKAGRHTQEFYQDLWKAVHTEGFWAGEVWNRKKNGEVYAELLTISTITGVQGQVSHYVGLFSDITKVKEHEMQLDLIAHFDPLTNLPNRLLLADRLHQAMSQAQRRSQSVAILYIDLDGFKAVNDKHGHEAGDLLLIATASHMKQALREGDTLARLGGDEFVAVLTDLDNTADSVPLLGRLLGAASAPMPYGDFLLQVSASIGATFFPQHEDIEADQLLRQADQAMYQAKIAGKSRFHIFDPEQDRSVRGHHESLQRIAQALGAHELVLYYQPKVHMRSGKVIGVEALLRWQHPEKGLLSPAAFLPVIEDHPLAIEVGEWVIATSLHQISVWRADGLKLRVSVNLGALQLQSANFVTRVGELLAAQPDVSASDLEFEVLETSALQDIAVVSRVMQQCIGMGLSFALDDFGTGYSSLTYLKGLPVATLKIDQSFVIDMLHDTDDLAILRGVIGLATAFRREVIAEGVETTKHGLLLLSLGCELAQGYGIARPMPAQDMPAWLTHWRTNPAWANA